MQDIKYTAIRRYLSENFPDCDIEQRNDFDRHAQSFRIGAHEGDLLLKVSDEFVEDNEVSEILKLMSKWSLAEALRNDGGKGVLFSQHGIELFARS